MGIFSSKVEPINLQLNKIHELDSENTHKKLNCPWKNLVLLKHKKIIALLNNFLEYHNKLISSTIDEKSDDDVSRTRILYSVNVYSHYHCNNYMNFIINDINRIIYETPISNFDDFEKKISANVRKNKQIASGAYGNTYLGQLNLNNIPIIIKVCRINDHFLNNLDFIKRLQINTFHEIFVGLYGTNSLREYIPNFAMIYSYYNVPIENINDGEYIQSASYHSDKIPKRLSPDHRVPYILYEHINGSVFLSMIKSLDRNFENFKKIINYYAQILLSLVVGYNKIKFTHYDLHLANIIIRDLPSAVKSDYVCINYTDNFALKCDKIATFIDYGLSYFEKFGDYFGNYFTNEKIDVDNDPNCEEKSYRRPDMSLPFLDLYIVTHRLYCELYSYYNTIDNPTIKNIINFLKVIFLFIVHILNVEKLEKDAWVRDSKKEINLDKLSNDYISPEFNHLLDFDVNYFEFMGKEYVAPILKNTNNYNNVFSDYVFRIINELNKRGCLDIIYTDNVTVDAEVYLRDELCITYNEYRNIRTRKTTQEQVEYKKGYLDNLLVSEINRLKEVLISDNIFSKYTELDNIIYHIAFLGAYQDEYFDTYSLLREYLSILLQFINIDKRRKNTIEEKKKLIDIESKIFQELKIRNIVI